MSVRPLAMPPAALSSTAFKATIVKPERLFRVSEYTVDKPYFGWSGRNRFDAPRPAKPVFGASYLGMSLHVAVAESLLHDEEPVDGRFLVAPGRLARLAPPYNREGRGPVRSLCREDSPIVTYPVAIGGGI